MYHISKSTWIVKHLHKYYVNLSSPLHLKNPSAGVQVIPRNQAPQITTNVGLQINTLQGSLGMVGKCKQYRSSCEAPLPQGQALPPPPDPILFPSQKILYFLSCLSLLSAATKGRLAAFTKHDKHEAARVRRLFPSGPEFTRTITWFLTNPQTLSSGVGLQWAEPPQWLPI